MLTISKLVKLTKKVYYSLNEFPIFYMDTSRQCIGVLRVENFRDGVVYPITKGIKYNLHEIASMIERKMELDIKSIHEKAKVEDDKIVCNNCIRLSKLFRVKWTKYMQILEENAKIEKAKAVYSDEALISSLHGV